MRYKRRRKYMELFKSIKIFGRQLLNLNKWSRILIIYYETGIF